MPNTTISTSRADSSPGGARDRSRIGKANGEKGKRAERDLVTWLRRHGFPGAERTVRTGYHTPARQRVDTGDIDGTPGLVFQVKDVADRLLWKVDGWLRETEAQRLAAGADVGVLVVKRRGHADPGHWWAWMPLCGLMPALNTLGSRDTVAGLSDTLRAGNTTSAADAADGVAAGDGVGLRWLTQVPVRLEVEHAVTLLRVAGYGEPRA